jgi:hypothetical protein
MEIQNYLVFENKSLQVHIFVVGVVIVVFVELVVVDNFEIEEYLMVFRIFVVEVVVEVVEVVEVEVVEVVEIEKYPMVHI